jgi:hypothetical protein
MRSFVYETIRAAMQENGFRPDTAQNVLLPLSPFRPELFTLVGAIAGEEISFGKDIILFSKDFNTRILSGMLGSITSLFCLIKGASDQEKQYLM